MSDEQEIQTRFVRVTEHGVKQEYDFQPFPTGDDQRSGPRVVFAMIEQHGDGELRHLSFDDPPAYLGTEERYREAMRQGVLLCDTEEEFVESLTRALSKDLVISHGCDPEVAIPAIIEFAHKVWAEYRIDTI